MVAATGDEDGSRVSFTKWTCRFKSDALAPMVEMTLDYSWWVGHSIWCFPLSIGQSLLLIAWCC